MSFPALYHTLARSLPRDVQRYKQVLSGIFIDSRQQRLSRCCHPIDLQMSSGDLTDGASFRIYIAEHLSFRANSIQLIPGILYVYTSYIDHTHPKSEHTIMRYRTSPFFRQAGGEFQLQSMCLWNDIQKEWLCLNRISIAYCDKYRLYLIGIGVQMKLINYCLELVWTN